MNSQASVKEESGRFFIVRPGWPDVGCLNKRHATVLVRGWNAASTDEKLSRPELQKIKADLDTVIKDDSVSWCKRLIDEKLLSMEDAAMNEVGEKVFVVHGHDDTMRLAVTRTLEQLGLEAVVLSEKPSQGRTIIEKFEHHSDVSYAVVLLSPDDMAFRKGGDVKKDEPTWRARQNVIFELGYFVGRLGRSNVMALKQGNVEVPSDYHGVVYHDYDGPNGRWKYELVSELQAQGYDVTADSLTSPSPPKPALKKKRLAKSTLVASPTYMFYDTWNPVPGVTIYNDDENAVVAIKSVTLFIRKGQGELSEELICSTEKETVVTGGQPMQVPGFVKTFRLGPKSHTHFVVYAADDGFSGESLLRLPSDQLRMEIKAFDGGTWIVTGSEIQQAIRENRKS
ncbi:MAG: hypothetical protein JWO38_1428 [Gemmataceae bacterium]|nr:hypothetical protein [Gemmataceae bacterium]